MFFKKSTFEKVHGFDESFFLYFEEYDLFKRLKEAGFSSFYVADTSIIHFRDMSPKTSFKKYSHYLKSMILFIIKHKL
jgi:hypothetical protein